jgi:plasmid segregation protein ParM
MRTLDLAIDIGSGFTKWIGNGDKKAHSIRSIVTPGGGMEEMGSAPSLPVRFTTECPPTGETTGETLELLVGDAAYDYGTPERRVNTLSTGWAGSQAWFALLYFALAETLGRQDPDAGARIEAGARIATGLPQAQYLSTRKMLEDRLRGKHVFEVAGRHYEVDIEPYILPQATAAIVHLAGMNASIMSDSVGLIDIGTYTTDIVVIEDGRIIRRRSGGCRSGVSNLIAEIVEYLRSRYGVDVDNAQIPRAMIRREIRLRGERIALDETISGLAQQASTGLLEGIAGVWPNAAADLRVIVVGGGAPFFINAIRTRIRHAELLGEPKRGRGAKPEAITTEEQFYSIVLGLRDWLVAQSTTPRSRDK